MPSNDGLMKRLKAIGKKYSTNITKDANRNLGKFKKLILVKSDSKVNGNTVEIISTASPKDNDKPVARAYEYGSGTRSRSVKRSRFQMGARGFIKIAPKNKKVLAFDWQTIYGPLQAGGKKLIGRSTTHIDERTGGYNIMFRYVEHPGVQAANNGKGYLAPAITKNRKPMNAEIAKEVGEEARSVLRRAFSKR